MNKVSNNSENKERQAHLRILLSKGPVLRLGTHSCHLSVMWVTGCLDLSPPFLPGQACVRWAGHLIEELALEHHKLPNLRKAAASCASHTTLHTVELLNSSPGLRCQHHLIQPCTARCVGQLSVT